MATQQPCACQELMEPWKLYVYEAGKWGHEQPNHEGTPAPGICFFENKGELRVMTV